MIDKLTEQQEPKSKLDGFNQATISILPFASSRFFVLSRFWILIERVGCCTRKARLENIKKGQQHLITF